MFSLTKLLALGAIIAAVIYGFRLYNRYQETRAVIDETRARRDVKREAMDRAQKSAEKSAHPDDTVDLVRDEKTGAWVPRERTDKRS